MFKNKFILLKNDKKGNDKYFLYEIKNNNINEIITKLLIISSLIVIINLIYHFHLFFEEKKNNHMKNNQRLNNNESIMGNDSLYKLYKYEQISLLISGINNWKINDKLLLIFINSLKHQTLKDIQTIFILPDGKENQRINLVKKSLDNNKKMKILSLTGNVESDNYYLMNSIRGKFIMIIENFVMFEQNELNNLFLLTNGKIDNYFEFQIQNHSFYLIKTKIVGNLIDKGHIFKNSNDLINHIILLPKPQLNYISIAMCPNDYYAQLTYVSMISILSSKQEFTFISFYLIISKDFKRKNIDFLLSLYEQFDYFNITFFKMDDRYKNAFLSKRMTIQTYYRFSLGKIIPYLKRILYLDSDIIVYKDLNKLYNLNFNGKIVLGQVTGYNKSKRTGIYHINNGILLFNLVQMRKMKVEEKAIEIIRKNERLKYHDQTLMNKYFGKYIGIFPIEYHIRNWGNFNDVKKWNKLSGNIYNNDYIYFAQKYPTIRHYLGPCKPMNSNKNHIEDWWFYARKSKYFKKKSFDFKTIFSF